MNDILKQRLVGALILLALGVIFWPIIFVQPGDREVAQQQSVPPRPGVSTQVLEAPDPVGLRGSPEPVIEELEEVETALPFEPPEPVKPVPAPPQDTVEVRNEPPKPLAMDSDGVPVAWILQVASVSSSEKADQLRDSLLAMGHKAHVKKVRSSGKNLYRVYIGPRFERAQLETLQGQIDVQFGVSSMIARHVP